MIEKLKLHKVFEAFCSLNPANRSEEKEEEEAHRHGEHLPELRHIKILTLKLNEVIDKLNETESSQGNEP
ncbi:MAG: hypothetical protein CMB80_05280 [Flammeovirgaceae bacterium]|nr:hypothetical protein [Flammeovirgaceae bacterium]